MSSTFFSRFSAALGLLGGALAAVASTPTPAHACGGFWCSSANPVNQSAEQIIFIDNPDETVTAVIQIQYVGPSERFAWVVPMPGTPEIEVSSNTVFDRLGAATRPQYRLEQEIEGMCMYEDFLFEAAPGASADDLNGAVDPMAPPPITIEDQGSVGPYDYVVISVDDSLAEPAQVAIDWFIENGYDLSGTDSEVLGPYLADGLNLLAFRLTKGNEAGAIRPVVLTYESSQPMIPIRPTAVAAQNDMGIRVWVSATTQAIPANYKSLVLNEALIDWINGAQNYDQVVTAAADEAGGQGFVTELAGATEDYKDVISDGSESDRLQDLANQSYTYGVDAIWAANSYYRGWDGWREAIEASVTLPAGTSIDDFARSPNNYRDTAEVDVPGFFAMLADEVVGPVEQTAELVNSRPYLTRLYSTMSAEEMTVDPAFDYNPDLADVSNIHMARQIIHCSPELYTWEAPWTIELPQGGVISGEGGGYQWPITLDDQPANLKIVQLTTSGSGEVVTDNSGRIGRMLFAEAGMMASPDVIPEPPAQGMTIGGSQTVTLEDPPMGSGVGEETSDGAPTSRSGSSGLCSVGGVGAGSGGLANLLPLLAVCALGLRRRRR